MPQPRRSESLTKPMSIRFTPEEREEIESQAAEAGLSCGAYVRRRTLGHPVRSHISLSNPGGGLNPAQTALVSQLNSLGGLLKNLHNQGIGHAEMTAQILMSLDTVVKKLGSSVGAT